MFKHFLAGVCIVAALPTPALNDPLPTFLLTSFGGVGDGITNNQKAFRAAFNHCDDLGGCRLILPRSDDGETVYRTSAVNLTSRLQLVVPTGVTLKGTETDEDNWGASWPTLDYASAPAPCAGTPGNCGCGPAKQAWIRGFNLSDVSISGGGTLHAGGRYWWCVRYNLKEGHRKWQPAMEQYGCATFVALPNVTLPDGGAGSMCPPRMMHIVESSKITISNITVTMSPYWTMHFQFSDQILVDGVRIFNPTNATFQTPNGDGIDIDSSTNALVRNCHIHAGDDALCVKSGADWLGRHVARPSENVTFEDCIVTSGHGLTIGSDASGGVRNVTFRRIHLQGTGGIGPGGPHFKTQRGRGGLWENILWDDIYGDDVSFSISFQENHGHGEGPVANASATPRLRNIEVRNVRLTNVMGYYQGIFTLSEMPIENLVLHNISFTMKPVHRGTPWACTAFEGSNYTAQNRLFAWGTAENLEPPLVGDGYNCTFSMTPPSIAPSRSGISDLAASSLSGITVI